MPHWETQFHGWTKRVNFIRYCFKSRVDPIHTMSRAATKVPVTLVKVRENSESEGLQNDNFQVGLKPFLICLKLAGLHHFRCSGTDRKKFAVRLGVTYRIFLLIVLLFNLLFSMGEYMHVSGFDGILLNNIITTVWFLQVLIFVLNNYIRSRRWERFYTHWNEYKTCYNLETKSVRTTGIVAVVCYFCWLTAAFAFMGFSLSAPRPPSGFWLYIPGQFVYFISAINIVAYFYFVTSWFLLTTQFTIICLVIYRLFLDLYRKVSRCLETKETFSKEVENLRQQHDKICAMTSEADDILSMFVMTAVGTTIPLIVLTLYYVLFVSTEHAFSLVATWWSISLGTVQLTVLFIFGGAVNYMVSSIIY